MKMDITLTEALTGMKKTIKSLDDRTLVIQTVRGNRTKIPMTTLTKIFFAGEVIKTGDVKQVQGEGMPHYRNPFEKGRLLIQFNVVFPANIEPAMAEALSKILPPV